MIYRHGDISFHPTEKIEGEKIEHNGSFVVAEGDTTGHMHTLSVPKLDDMEVYRTADGGMIIRLKTDGEITHQEHKKLVIPAGDYKVMNEREYDWFSLAVRRVVD